MIPALGIVQIGRRARFPIPLPFVLLWPLIGLAGLLLWPAAWLSGRGTEAARRLDFARRSVLLLFHLSGLKVDVRSADGESVRILLY